MHADAALGPSCKAFSCEASAETRLVPSSGKSSQMSTALTQPVPCARVTTAFFKCLNLADFDGVSFCELKSKSSSRRLECMSTCFYQYFTTLVLIEELSVTS